MRRKTGKTLGLLGIAGAVVGGGTMIASAAGPGTQVNTISNCTNQRVAAPAAPVYEKTVVVGPNGTVNDTIVSPKAATTALGVTAKTVRFEVRTQYSSGGSTAKSGVIKVSVNNHAAYNNPVLFNIPPVDNSFTIGADEALTYSLSTKGAVATTVTIREYVAEAVTNGLVIGPNCPTGSERTSYTGDGTT